ncbi:hypothetical protein BC936DRAFT_144057 [Jimgerdemannia flammicorona]|uniref:Uncharacterized protein n=1 Tax=Jimgerdemannia flammicorona TaxID=994334 RepID=A0A433DD30_9FUNG|nr:hypothetical protein BC936DRAFT_144057 [Jimgerdemannia flammicorona]
MNITKMNSFVPNCSQIGVKETSALAEALKMNTGLPNLNLEDNNIGGMGASALAEALTMNTSLQDIDLGCM